MTTNSPVFKLVLFIALLFFTTVSYGQTTSSTTILTKQEVKEKLDQHHKKINTYKSTSQRKVPKKKTSQTTKSFPVSKQSSKKTYPVHIKQNGKVKVINPEN